MANFEELGINATLRKAIDELGFVMPMPVQEAVIPQLLTTLSADKSSREAALDTTPQDASTPAETADDTPTGTAEAATVTADTTAPDNIPHDIIALAQTGTGKTAAFGLPLLQALDLSRRETQAVIMSPTRELCLQISDDLRDFGKYMEGLRITAVYGGAPIDSQIRQLRKGTHVIVATPGRLVDLTERGVADISTASTIVLDEADEMLNMGFSESINNIFDQLPPSRHTLLFSATMSKEVERIARQYLHDYKEIVVGSRNEGAENVDHTYYMVHAKDKYLALKRIVDYYPRIYAIIFCRTKIETQEIADKLIRDGYNAESLHGDLSQPQRDQTMQKFRQHTVQLLVATDVAARGLDVNDLTHVINYGMPDDTESYTHRSGRTGRAGKKGSSIAIIHSREQSKIRAVEKIIQKKFTHGTLPSPTEICKKQLFRVMDHISKVDVDDETINPFMEEIQRHFQYFDKDDIIKKIVMMEFGKFLEYYADEPDIEEPQPAKKGARDNQQGRRKDRNGRDRGPEHRAEKGYKRLFINLGKAEGFYPGEVMQFINQHVSGRGRGGQAQRQEVGHIDLMSHYCFIEVPERDAKNVMAALDGTTYHGRQVRCNAEGDSKPEGTYDAPVRRNKRRDDGRPFMKPQRQRNTQRGEFTADDWRDLMSRAQTELKGDIPDFSEEGWARRKPRKKKK
ncbi:MAG: DEAD/DEAH box helicase [Prevotella sp.]